MGIKIAINEMHRKYYGVLEGIERVKKQLEEIELIPKEHILDKDLTRLENKIKRTPVRAMTSISLGLNRRKALTSKN